METLTQEKINYSPAICKIVLQFQQGLQEEIDRFHVNGNIATIESALKVAGVYEPWMSGLLLMKEDLAKETL